jgi:hypothetical protein
MKVVRIWWSSEDNLRALLRSRIVESSLGELFADIPKGARLTVISDSCHSGSVTRVIVPKSSRERRNRELAPNVWGSRMLSGEQMSAACKRKRQQKGEKVLV